MRRVRSVNWLFVLYFTGAVAGIFACWSGVTNDPPNTAQALIGFISALICSKCAANE